MRFVFLLAALLGLGACHSADHAPPAQSNAPPEPRDPPSVTRAAAPDPRPLDAASTAKVADAPAAPLPPATVERFAVPGDSVASIVRSPDGSLPHIVFLPGLCANAYAYLLGFPEAARAHGGAVAIEGDRPCGAPNSGFRSLSWDPVRQHARVQAALAAAGLSDPPPEGLTLVGYSAGAAVAELMAQQWPERYTRVVLIGAPSDPSAARLAQARGVVTMSCSRDVPARMRGAAQRLTEVGVPATYLEMPGCTHGNITEGDRIFGSAFDWLAENARPPKG